MPGSYIVAIGVVMVIYALDSHMKISETGYQTLGMSLSVIIPAIVGVVAMYVGSRKFNKEFWDQPTNSNDSS